MGNNATSGDNRVSLFSRIQSVFVKIRAIDAIEVEECIHKGGIVSAEAVEWFMERDNRTMTQSLSFIPWVIQKGIKDGTVTESTDSVCIVLS